MGHVTSCDDGRREGGKKEAEEGVVDFEGGRRGMVGGRGGQEGVDGGGTGERLGEEERVGWRWR